MTRWSGLSLVIVGGAVVAVVLTAALDDPGRSFPALRELPLLYFASGTLTAFATAHLLRGPRAKRVWRAIAVAYVTLSVAGTLAIVAALRLLFMDGQPIGYGAPRTLNGAFYLGLLPPLVVWIVASRGAIPDWRGAARFGALSWGIWLAFVLLIVVANGLVKQYLVYRRFSG